MRETARSAELRVADGGDVTLTSISWPRRRPAIGSASGGPSAATETSSRRRARRNCGYRPRASPDGPPTDSEHAECP